MNRIIKYSRLNPARQIELATFKNYPDAVEYFQTLKARMPDDSLELIPANDHMDKAWFHNCEVA